MSELIEHSRTPLLLTERKRVSVANNAAREILGEHMLGQDVRVAFRHPDAVALLDQSSSGTATVRGLVRRLDIWQINYKRLDANLGVIELVNQTAEADISRAHTDFVANASHELRTPLASVIGYIETLSDEDADYTPETRGRFFATVLSEARRLQSLISDLMSLSQVEAEKHDRPTGVIRLKELVEGASIDAAGPDRQHRLLIECHEDSTIVGEARQIEQVIRNLVDNALKYSGINETVVVSLDRAPSGDARLRVTDYGEGIAPEHIPHLTRRFYRTDPGRSRASGGTGLGLAIVKHIVERHKGRLDIDSEVGKGTVFTVRFPASEKAVDDVS